MTTQVRLAVPAAALGGLTEHLLRVGVAAAVLEHLGDTAETRFDSDDGVIHIVPGPGAQADRRAADGLVTALGAWLDDVVGTADRRARVELEIPVYPQLPQGNPLFGRSGRVTPVTSWG